MPIDSPLIRLTISDMGIYLLNKYPCLRDKITEESLNATVNYHDLKGTSALVLLVMKDAGIGLLENDSNLLAKVNEYGINSIIYENEQPFTSVLYGLILSERGLLLLEKSSELRKKLTAEALSVIFYDQGVQNSSVLKGLINNPIGYRILKNDSVLVEKIELSTFTTVLNLNKNKEEFNLVADKILELIILNSKNNNDIAKNTINIISKLDPCNAQWFISLYQKTYSYQTLKNKNITKMSNAELICYALTHADITETRSLQLMNRLIRINKSLLIDEFNNQTYLQTLIILDGLKLNSKIGRYYASNELRALLMLVDDWCHNLNGLHLNNCSLQEVKLQHSMLSHTNFSYSNLRGANLSHSNLKFANLKSADLRNADLRNAKLKKANLRNAKLEGAKIIRLEKNLDLNAEKLIEQLNYFQKSFDKSEKNNPEVIENLQHAIADQLIRFAYKYSGDTDSVSSEKVVALIETAKVHPIFAPQNVRPRTKAASFFQSENSKALLDQTPLEKLNQYCAAYRRNKDAILNPTIKSSVIIQQN